MLEVVLPVLMQVSGLCSSGLSVNLATDVEYISNISAQNVEREKNSFSDKN
jgi:hypothetical protein